MDRKQIVDSLFEIDDNNEIIKTFKIQDTLSSDIFKDNIMDKSVREKLLEITDEFIEFLGVDVFIHDIILTGSLSNYNWSKYSDIDLHILIDFEEFDYGIDFLKEFFDSKKTVWNTRHKISIKGFEVELYIQDVNEKHVSSGVYSILKNKWLVEPTKEIVDIDKDKILTKSEIFEKKIDNLVVKFKEGENISDDIQMIIDKLKKFRKCGLDKSGEYSYENLTFKLLRRNGYIDKLYNLKTKFKDKKLSLKQ
jgi:hypothetical protein